MSNLATRIFLISVFAAVVIAPQLNSQISNQEVMLPDNYPELPLSAFEVPISRFGPGRPSYVDGLKIVSADPIRKTITLSWKSNPIKDHVDMYAVYYRTTDAITTDYRTIGSLVAVTTKTTLTSKLVGDVNTSVVGSYAPYGINEIPIQLLGTKLFPVPEGVWVIAHNKNGWGNNDDETPNPDENPNTFTVYSLNQQKVPLGPGWVTLDLETLVSIDKRFSAKGWPKYKKVADILNLDGIPPKSPWVIPWLPPYGSPPNRYQPGRPSDIKGLKVVMKYGKQKIFQLTWDASPASEHVDSYVVYGNSADGCPMDHCYYWPFAIVYTNHLKTKLIYTGTAADMSDGWATPMYENGAVEFTYSHADAYIYVIAHNARGWGNNTWDALDPDQGWEDKKEIIGGFNYPPPSDIIKVVAP